MDEFAIYFSNYNWVAIFDIVLCLACLILGFLFFYHKRSLKIYYLLLALVAVKFTADIINAYSPNQALLITKIVMQYVILFVLFAIVVAYKADFRSIFQRIAVPSEIDLYKEGYGNDDDLRVATDEMLSALQVMAKKDIGAIIILTPTTIDNNILDTGTRLNALVSSSLLVSIFNTKAPLHDGAVIIKGNKILSAGCFLPLTEGADIAKDLGTRHRAAIGITEQSDVVAIVVSEETGIISIAEKGHLSRYMTIDKLKEKIEMVYGISPMILDTKIDSKFNKKRKRLK